MLNLQKFGYTLFLLFSIQTAASAQEPNLAPADLEYSKKIIGRYHVIAEVVLEMEENKFKRYQWDHYPTGKSGPEVDRIKMESGTFAKIRGKTWLRSDDWGGTGKAVQDDIAQELNTYVSIVNSPFAKSVHHDTTQGDTVWKFIEQTKDKTAVYFTYEESREKPHPNGVYPLYTFRKFDTDVDGNLFLCKLTGQLRNGGREVPFAINYDFFIPLPANTIIKIMPPSPEQKLGTGPQ